MLSRRTLLILMGSILFSSCYQDEKENGKQDNIDPHLTELLNELSLRKWSLHVGKELYDANPKQFESVYITELFDQNFSLPKVSDIDEFKEAVQAKIKSDFRSNRITTYQGWIFSEKESVLYVLAFLLTNLKKDTVN